MELITYLNEFGKWLVMISIIASAICSASDCIVDMPTMPLYRLLGHLLLLNRINRYV